MSWLFDRCVDHELQSRVIVELEASVFEDQRAAIGVVDYLAAGPATPSVVALPPGGELRAAGAQQTQQIYECRISRPQVVGGAERGDHPLGFRRPARPEQYAA